MVMILLVGLIASLVTVMGTVGLVLLVVIYNNTKKEILNDDILTVPFNGYGGGGHGAGQTVSLDSLMRMYQLAQAAKDKETHKADVGGGQYL